MYIYLMKKLIFILFIINCGSVGAQDDSLGLIKINQQIDDYVVSRNVKGLDSLYGEDFVFSHGSGRVEGKKNWLGSVSRNNYPQRQHDSVRVEMHPGVAILKGKMFIQRIDKDKTARYHLRYIRVYANRLGRWQLISHSTTHEWHE